ncbi:MAG: RNA polymerase sigma factor [Vallitalea sp.]|nr:RNA polymerase sigma factor [Vallitalea sp.]
MDENYIEQLKRQDQIAFRQLVTEYQSYFLTMAYKFTNNYSDAEDLSQEIFIKVYNSLPRFKGHSKLSTWLYKIAMNTCLDWKRKTKINLHSIIHVLDKSVEDMRNKHTTEEIIVYKENQQIIHKAVFGLKDKYKSIVILYHFNQLSYKEISYIMDIPIKTVETRLYRARKQIKDKLIEQGIGGEIIEIQRV